MAAPIRHLVILGHPSAGSFNHTIAEAWCEAVRDYGQEPVLRDLYALGFDPLLRADERTGAESGTPAADVAEDIELVRQAAVITLVYPIWFGMPPAIIKGYVDRVLGAGFGPRDLKSGVPHPVLHGKHMVILSSSASTLPWLEEKGQWVALRQAFDSYLASIFALASHAHLHFDAVVEGMTTRTVQERIEEARLEAGKACARAFEDRRAADLGAKLRRDPA